jgi:hypothetical protein
MITFKVDRTVFALVGEHICAYPHELPDGDHPNEQCSPVGIGSAVLNPSANGLDHLTALDLADIRRHRGPDWEP